MARLVRLVIGGQSLPLRDGNYVIGRGPECDVVVDSSHVSRRHALLSVQGDIITIEDLESRNGVWLDFQRIESRTVLQPGVSMRIGKTQADLLVVANGDDDESGFPRQQTTVDMETPSDVAALLAAQQDPATQRGDDDEDDGPLSDEEKRLLSLVLAGCNDAQAARRLFDGLLSTQKHAAAASFAPDQAIRTLVEHVERSHASQPPDARHSDASDLGTLAAGVVHDLNEPLNAINLIVQSRLREISRISGTADEQGDFEEVLQLVRRMGTIIDDVRSFTRREDDRPFEAVDVNRELTQALWTLQRQLDDAAIEVHVELGDVAPIQGRGGQLQRVFVNLLKNARDALEARDGARHVWLTSEPGDAGEVRVRIRDDAGGIPEDIQGRVLEPFFTTKGAGKGTGLGLSICDRIVRDCGGRLQLGVDPEGTTFTLTLIAAAPGR